MRPEKINIHDYTYDLPDRLVARFPLPERDRSRLLVYSGGQVSHHRFAELPALLKKDMLLVFNETRVIQARLLLSKESGASIEIFVLDPVLPAEMERALSATGSVVWKCMIGNKKRFRPEDNLQLELGDTVVNVSWHDREQDEVHFSWRAEISFAEILQRAGQIPIPPYLQRKPVEKDKTVYQTVYSRVEGSVAAPTAGLHFTPAVMDQLQQNGIATDFITLHVGAGTFRPVKSENAIDHEMHAERVFFTRSNIDQLMRYAGSVIPVGTTSLRSLESLYWFGVGLLEGTLEEFGIPQYFPYDRPQEKLPSAKDALQAVLDYMDRYRLGKLSGSTSIYIVPGYRFHIPSALITNFHQPGSTLVLLVAAWIGEDWKKVYEAAITNEYRFLSYGDSCLLMP